MRAQGYENISKKTRHMQAPGQPDLCVGHVISVIGSSSLAEAFSGNAGDCDHRKVATLRVLEADYYDYCIAT